jgi:hypothetical protein
MKDANKPFHSPVPNSEWGATVMKFQELRNDSRNWEAILLLPTPLY